MIYLLSMELFGKAIPLTWFPKLTTLRGFGMSDWSCYASRLASKFNYLNTFYDREPRIDFAESHPNLSSTADFVLSADVLEHIDQPVERAINEIWKILKPNGFLAATVPVTRDGAMLEHFPELFQYRILQLGDAPVLVNRRKDGTVEVNQDLVFHGGEGNVLEMRQFGLAHLHSKLLSAGFREVEFLLDDLPDFGILFDDDVSQPFIARKAPFALDRAAQIDLTSQWLTARHGLTTEQEMNHFLTSQMRMASDSKWLRMGRRFGLGPVFKSSCPN